tara:strand:+ start:1084 stop:1734 length:651 start_codon:yes stop_codon:yes gene_type:complete
MEKIRIEHDKYYEVGIFLQPDDALFYYIQDLTKRICKNHKNCGVDIEQDKNQPHVTLFQLSIKGDNIPKISKYLAQAALDLIRVPRVALKPELSVVGANLFWNVDALFQNPLLKKVHKNIVEMMSPLRSEQHIGHLEENYSLLSDAKKSDVDQYGICWSLPHNFDPHFTIIYNMPFDFNLDLVPSISQCSFKPAYLGVGLLGYHGNVTDILWRTKL